VQVYIYQADLHCAPCTLAIKAELERDGHKPANVADEYSYDSDNWPKGPHADIGESDTPQHCGTCDMFLQNSLTPDGEEYVRECARGGRIPLEWREYYDYLDIEASV
jgi:hypothetical protein